ncbi:Uncharacterised protein [Escherichia coli]|nr:Uncharacterised protein [Escherichia coli]
MHRGKGGLFLIMLPPVRFFMMAPLMLPDVLLIRLLLRPLIITTFMTPILFFSDGMELLNGRFVDMRARLFRFAPDECL